MIYPLENWSKIKRGYGFGVKTFYSSHHLGVDYIIPENTPIYAPIKCEITVSNIFPQGGNTIHAIFNDDKYGKLVMRCMHLNKLFKKGTYNEGDIIGYSGNTGNFTTAPHLHLDLSRNRVNFNDFNNFIDPDKYFIDKINNNFNINYMMKLIQNTVSKKVYAIGEDNKKHWIFNEETFNIGKELKLWGDWDEIEKQDDDSFEEGHVIILISKS